MGRREVTVKARRATPSIYRIDNHRWRVLKAKHKAYSKERQLPCWLAPFGMCLLDGVPIDYHAVPGSRAAYETDHVVPRAVNKDLMYVWNNLRASHCTCNRSRQAKPVEQQHVWVRPSF